MTAIDYNPMNTIGMYEAIARKRRRRGKTEKVLPYSGAPTSKCKVNDAISKPLSGSHHMH